MKWIQPTPEHYWDTKSMSWKLPSDCSELIHTSGSTMILKIEPVTTKAAEDLIEALASFQNPKVFSRQKFG